LDKDGCSCHGGEAEWSLPTRNADGTWTPGEWMPEIEGELKPCRNGYHVVTLEQLPNWIGERIFEVEVGKEILPDDDKSVVRTCRLTRECTGWDERTARLFACDCAEHVLCLYEAQYPDDRRPRKAIETARRYAEGKAAVEDLTDVWDAAWAAARDAAEAARDAAWEAAAWAAGVAAGVAAGAAGAAAWAAVWSAAGAVWDAAAAAREAAWEAAAWAAGVAAGAAWDAEQQWQVERLGEILELAYRERGVGEDDRPGGGEAE
jgi:hypothetical protein